MSWAIVNYFITVNMHDVCTMFARNFISTQLMHVARKFHESFFTMIYSNIFTCSLHFESELFSLQLCAAWSFEKY